MNTKQPTYKIEILPGRQAHVTRLDDSKKFDGRTGWYKTIAGAILTMPLFRYVVTGNVNQVTTRKE